MIQQPLAFEADLVVWKYSGHLGKLTDQMTNGFMADMTWPMTV